MEPMTINLDGLNSIGQYVYPLIYVLVSAFFGTISRRHFGHAGECLGGDTRDGLGRREAMKGRTHIVNGSVTGTLGVAAFVAALVTSIILFNHAVDKADPPTVSVTAGESHFGPFTADINKLEEVFQWYSDDRHSYQQSQEEIGELRKLVEAMAGVGAEDHSRCSCGALLADGHCVRLIAQFGKQGTVEETEAFLDDHSRWVRACQLAARE